jgi:hypothetical protein
MYPIYNHNWRNISTIYIYNKTNIKKIFAPSDEIYREVGRAKDLSAPQYVYVSFKVRKHDDCVTLRNFGRHCDLRPFRVYRFENVGNEELVTSEIHLRNYPVWMHQFHVKKKKR